MLIKKIFRGLSVSITIAFTVVAVAFGLGMLGVIYYVSSGNLLLTLIGGFPIIIALIQGLIQGLAWLGQESEDQL